MKNAQTLAPVFRDVQKEYLSVKEAEILTGKSRWGWRRYAYQGKIDSVKLGRRLLIPLVEIRRVLAEGSRPRLQDSQQ